MLCYCIQIIFTSSIRNRDDTCFRCFKQAVAFWFRFPAWVQRAPSVALLRLSRGRFVLLRLLSCGDLKLLRDVTGKALLCSAVVEFVAPWCYGFGTVLDFFRWLAPRWASSGPARVGGRSCESGKRSFEEFQRVQRFKRCSSHVQESERAHTAHCFKLCGFGHRPQAAGPISVRMGRSPACTAHSCKALSCDEK